MKCQFQVLRKLKNRNRTETVKLHTLILNYTFRLNHSTADLLNRIYNILGVGKSGLRLIYLEE